MTDPRRAVLIVDDDQRIRTSLSAALADERTDVHVAESGEAALASLAAASPGVVLADLRMPGMDGLELLRLLKARAPHIDVIIMTAHEDLPTVAAAMGAGASEFLVKPLDLHQLRRVLETVLEDRAERDRAPHPEPHGLESPYELVGRDPRMVEIFKTVGRVAQSRTTVVIRGESGTGKELIARAIHAGSPLAGEPFVAVNCTALPASLLESELFGHVRGAFTGATADRRGRFAAAGSGTIFLDEVGDTQLEFQAKLLRVLQEREYFPVGADKPAHTDARVIAATHRHLETLVADGRFREDLYYRLRVVEIVVPPLRERPADVPVIAERLVARVCRTLGKPPHVISVEAMDALLAHPWPGNVRELENTVTRAVVAATGDVIRPEHLGLAAPAAGAAPERVTLEDAERVQVVRVLTSTGWNKSRAAELLGVSRPRLDRLIAKYALHPPADA